MSLSGDTLCFGSTGVPNNILTFGRKGVIIKGIMAIDKEIVRHVAHLARIELQTKELEKLSHQLQNIIDFIDQLKSADIKDINPTSHILALSNVFRQDNPKDSLPSEKALMNAPAREGDFFVVPRVIED